MQADRTLAQLEGVPVQFDGTGTTSICGLDSLALRWDFSDGGVAFGQQPFHTFEDNGIFSGLLTATDPTGLSNSVAFSVSVANQDPVANAGPDTIADWGRLVQFNGQATDPGEDDQPFLEYSWDFGDGTLPTNPSTGGASALHAYAAPGDYTATLDRDRRRRRERRRTAGSFTSRSVTSRPPTSGRLRRRSTPATSFSGSLVDEYGTERRRTDAPLRRRRRRPGRVGDELVRTGDGAHGRRRRTPASMRPRRSSSVTRCTTPTPAAAA